LTKNLLRKESKLPISLEQIFHFYLVKKLRLIVTGMMSVTLPVTSASCERSYSKMKLVKMFPSNSMTCENIGNIDLLQLCSVQPAAQSKVSCGPVKVFAVVKVSCILTTCPF